MALKYATVHLVTNKHYDCENKTWVDEMLYDEPYIPNKHNKKTFSWPTNCVNVRIDTEFDLKHRNK